jgi:hypothetical protein
MAGMGAAASAARARAVGNLYNTPRRSVMALMLCFHPKLRTINSRLLQGTVNGHKC